MPMYKRSMFVFLLLAAVVLSGLFYGYGEKDEARQLASAEKQAPVESIAVYVSGAVNKPGVVSLPAGSRVIDAVNRCGGVLPSADAAKVNMAQPLKDGAQISVPERAAALPGEPTEAAKSDGKININQADAKALDSLPGIGPAMAERIIAYRKQSGGFQSLDELKKVQGIGEAKFAKLKDKITL